MSPNLKIEKDPHVSPNLKIEKDPHVSPNLKIEKKTHMFHGFQKKLSPILPLKS